MERRALLKTGAAGGVVAGLGTLAEGGCAHVPPPEAPADDVLLASLDAVTADRVLAKMDQRLASIDTDSGGPLMAKLLPPGSPERKAEYDRYGRLFRASVRSLYMTGCFLEAPLELQAHPGMQARLAAAQGSMDEAVFGTVDMLESMTPAQFKRVQDTLRERPEVAEELARLLDEPAKVDGMPLKRRYVLRSGILEVASKMRAQSPALVADPYIRKVRRIAARDPVTLADDSVRLASARIGEAAFWDHQERMARVAAGWERKLAQAGGAPGAPMPSPYEPPVPAPASGAPAPAGGAPAPAGGAPAPASPVPAPAATARSWSKPTQTMQPPVAPPPPLPGSLEHRTSGQRTLSAGAHMMGYGLASVGAGLLFAGIAEAGATAFVYPALVFGVTIGPILLVTGLLVVIIGAIIRATEP